MAYGVKSQLRQSFFQFDIPIAARHLSSDPVGLPPQIKRGRARVPQHHPTQVHNGFVGSSTGSVAPEWPWVAWRRLRSLAHLGIVSIPPIPLHWADQRAARSSGLFFAAKMVIEVAPDPAAESMIEGYETGQERGCRVQFPHTRRVDGALGDSDRE